MSLPVRAEPLAGFAARLFGDAHALDAGTARATLAVRAATRLAGVPFEDDAEGRRSAWASVGIYLDELSTPALLLNLPANSDSPLARLLRTASLAGEPLHLSLRWLMRDGWLLASGVAESLLSFVFVYWTLRFFDVAPMYAATAAAIAVATSPAVLLMIVHDQRAKGPLTERMLTLTGLNNVIAFLVSRCCSVSSISSTRPIGCVLCCTRSISSPARPRSSISSAASPRGSSSRPRCRR